MPLKTLLKVEQPVIGMLHLPAFQAPRRAIKAANQGKAAVAKKAGRKKAVAKKSVAAKKAATAPEPSSTVSAKRAFVLTNSENAVRDAEKALETVVELLRLGVRTTPA